MSPTEAALRAAKARKGTRKMPVGASTDRTPGRWAVKVRTANSTTWLESRLTFDTEEHAADYAEDFVRRWSAAEVSTIQQIT